MTMNPPVGGQGPRGVDLAAVALDDQLLDLLGARAGTPADDQVAALLAAFADEVDDGLAELLADADAFAVPAADVAPGVRRGRALRVTSLALVVGATLSVSGVAAAVTGDPFAPYKGLASVVVGADELPAHAARVAAMQHTLRGTRARIAHGDLAGARADLTALRARLDSTTGLSHGERSALEARIAALEAALARAEAKPAGSGPANKTGGASPNGRPSDAGKKDHQDATTGDSRRGGGQGADERGGAPTADKTKPAKPAHPAAGQENSTDPDETTAVVSPDDGDVATDGSADEDVPTVPDDQGGNGDDRGSDDGGASQGRSSSGG